MVSQYIHRKKRTTDERYIEALTTSRTISEAATVLGLSRSRVTNKSNELLAKGILKRGTAFVLDDKEE